MSDDNYQSDTEEPPNPKRIKTEEQPPLLLKDFVSHKILYNNSKRKTVCVLGNFKGKSGVAIVTFEKNAFREEDLNDTGYFSEDSKTDSYFQNDIYRNFECYPNSSINGIKTTVIYPATDKHTAKFSHQQGHIISEAPELYEKFTLPHIEHDHFTLEWVYNILDGTSEQEKIIHDNKCEKDGFVLLPDLKWDGHSTESLYLLAIVRRRGIKSLRDLDSSHLPLLKRIRDEGKKVIFDKYNVVGSQLRIYLHYQPSFYHLHVHFTYVKHEATGIFVERSHLLDTVINNIEMMGDYYQKATIAFSIREMDSLFSVYEKNGYIKKIEENTELVTTNGE